MLLRVPAVLDTSLLSTIRSSLDEAEWIDGGATARGKARQVKHNLQLPRNGELAQRLGKLVLGALERSEGFRLGAQPHTIFPPTFSRYEPGMAYGDHLDLPIMGAAGRRYRTDVAFTLFLDEPDTYDGGELVFASDYGEQRLKCEAGELVLYPASTIHRVEAVRRGHRRVILSWVQSLVRDPAQRQLLYDLAMAANGLESMDDPPPESQVLRKSYYNLLRMWSEV